MKTRIHVNQHVIRSNRKTGANEPVLTIKTYRGTSQAHAVSVHGPSRMVYSPDKPLACGAHVWLETTSEVSYGELAAAGLLTPEQVFMSKQLSLLT